MLRSQKENPSISIYLSVLGRLQEKLLAARPKSVKYREIVADGMGIMGPDPRTSGV